MSETTQDAKTPEQKQHESNKFIREKLAWLHYRMNSIQFFLEEAQIAQEARGILAAFCQDLQVKIEEVEPPVKQDESTTPKGPYIIDAGKPNLEAVQ